MVSRVTYNTGRDQRVHFFGTVRLFSKNFFPTKGPPSIFWSFATEWMLKNHKRSSLSVFFGIVDFFSFFFHKSSPNSPILGIFEVLLLFLIWRRLGPFPACLITFELILAHFFCEFLLNFYSTILSLV